MRRAKLWDSLIILAVDMDPSSTHSYLILSPLPRRKRSLTLTRLSAKSDVMHQKDESSDKFDMHQAFAKFDLNGNGEIKVSEFKSGIRNLGVDLTEEQLSMLCRRLDKNGDGFITYDEFCKRIHYSKADLSILADRLRARHSERAQQGVSPQEVFSELDRNGDGKITRKELRDALQENRTRPL